MNKLVILFLLSVSIQFSLQASGEFDYKTLGDDWTSLGSCGGQVQSPVKLPDLASATRCGATTEVSVEFPDREVDFEVNQLKHSRNSLPPAYLNLYRGGVYETFAFLQFHFHSQSEHTIDNGVADGRRFPFELHMVFMKPNADDTQNFLSVVGVLLEEDESVTENPLKFIEPTANPVKRRINFKNDLEAVLGSQNHYYHYNGSLTTPPCSEAVNWFVQQTPVKVPVGFKEAWIKHLPKFEYFNNYRNVQPLNGRTVCVVKNTENYVKKSMEVQVNTVDNRINNNSGAKLGFIAAAFMLVFAIFFN